MDKLELNISNLRNCIDSLKNCSKDYKENSNKTIKEYIEDACIKRFEYTIETSWKIMKKYLKLKYGKTDKELTMNNIFRLMEGYDFIQSWENWRYYYDKRNDTSHEYNKNKAKEVLNIIDNLVVDCEYLYSQLKKAINQ